MVVLDVAEKQWMSTNKHVMRNGTTDRSDALSRVHNDCMMYIHEPGRDYDH
jgi:hypothetical protein